MGLKVRLEWFDKTTEWLVGTEESEDLGEDYSVVTKLGLSKEKAVNNGLFELRRDWVSHVQPLFIHEIALSESDYFIAFDYEDAHE
ncbi:colicin E3-like toxin immunity protein [Pseudomonas costantinii]|uniref:colicin E3-like toxin immunity protein n=1 Tax=Pseudomonas costantinii TaxID=168469 RepID=UPI00159F9054|nr:colicin E3-like toxin immunity protein [Pseudomonas costantinii]NVZ72480.1 colicin transporter [Pseudomonas costantinii]